MPRAQYQPPNTKQTPTEKSAFESGLLFLREDFFSNSIFVFVFGRTLIPECVYRPKDHFHFFVKSVKTIVKRMSNLGFLGFL